ncbi:VrrB [Legionella pneumophila serogroup 1]|uniref:VrrB n=1 Tax=Legionella pneumophila TaxID=446 RepID=UPI0009B02884|nr:VrrB [Legionella pneumophila]MDW9174438.1 VrrB [Legionella pneumophila]HAT4425598.1 VrrB [Legionella pneumophila]HAT8691252.1 VrrB [Legionella pneumophila]
MWTPNLLKLFVAVTALIGSTVVAAYDTSIKNDSHLGSMILAANPHHAPHWTPHGGHGWWHWNGHRWHWIQYHKGYHHNWHQNWHHGGQGGHGGGH